MGEFQISSVVSGMILGVYTAESEEGALDAMARDAGYADYRESVLIAKTGYESSDEIDEMVRKARAEMAVERV